VHQFAEVVALGEKCIVSDLACLLSIHCHNTMQSKAPFYPCSITAGADDHDFILLESFTDIYILRNNLTNVLRTIKKLQTRSQFAESLNHNPKIANRLCSVKTPLLSHLAFHNCRDSKDSKIHSSSRIGLCYG